MKIEQFFYTTNPNQNGAFCYLSKSAGITRDTENLIGAGYTTFQSASLSGSGYEQQESREEVLKNGAKKNIFGKYKKSDYEWKDFVIREKIEIIAESQSGRILLNGDFRQNPEKAPYRIAKMKLADGRLLVARLSGIGRVYSDLDNRTGNFFEHGFIFPADAKLTDDQIRKLPFKNGLSPQEMKSGLPEQLPSPELDELLKTPVKQSAKTSKMICYGSIIVPETHPLAEIDSLISSLAVNSELLADAEKKYADGITADDFDIRNYEDLCEKDKQDLTEKMKIYPQKDVLKKFLNERKTFFRSKSEKDIVPLYRKDAHYQDLATSDTQKIYTFKVERTK